MKFVSYLRVSTTKQGQSGLGLEAQQEIIARYIGDSELLASFTEIESGRKSKRPQLALALATAKANGATLIVAKLDRLARDSHFIGGLLRDGVDFIACDAPFADRLMIQIMAAFGEYEARQISIRTKGALAARKARGFKLGNPNLTADAQSLAVAKNQANAKEHNELAYPIAKHYHDLGRSLREIATMLTGRGLMTRRGKAWTATAVMRLLA